MLSKRLALSCLLSVLLTPPWASPGSALTPYLVKDINEEVSHGASAPTFEASLANGLTLFQATENTSGRELWRSDGTPEGTFLLLDSCAGPCSLPYQRVATGGGRAFFLLTDQIGLLGDLWVTGGSPADTFRIATGLQIPRDRPAVWVPRLRLLFFVAADGEHGFELWRSDGTEAGTDRLTDLAPGAENAAPAELTLFRGNLAFVADDGSQGPALWVSDGTREGTRLLRDPVPARADHPAPAFLAAAGSRLIFSAPTPSGQTMLWRSDGTRPGTVPFANLVPGPDEPVVHGATAIGGRFYLVATTPGAGQELWSSDGTAQGTRRLTHLVDSEVRGPGEVRLPFPAPRGKAAFMAFDEVHGIELWLTDGTPAGTRSTDICPGDCSGIPQLFFTGKLQGDRLYFPADDGRRGTEMWTSDGTVEGTRLLRDLCPGCSSNPATSSVSLGDVVLFTVNSGLNGARVARLFRTDGTPAGTVRIASYPSVGLTLDENGKVPGALLFFGPDAELWRTDGTAAGTGLLKDIEGSTGLGSFPKNLFAVGDRVFFEAVDDPGHLPGFWVSGGTPESTFQRGRLPSCIRFLKILPDGDPIVECPGGNRPGSVLYRIPRDLPPILLTPDDVGVTSRETAVLGGLLFFVANDGEIGPELWKTDGTPEGTTLVLDLSPGFPSSNPTGLTVFQGRLWFSGIASDVTGAGLWSTDGTAEGTERLPFPGAHVTLHGAYLGRLWFTAGDDEHGVELWSTDGTAAGTRVLDVIPGPSSSWPVRLKSAGGRIFFLALGEEQRGLWTSDGTEAGTQRLGGEPIALHFQSFAPSHAAVGGRLFYRSEEGRLWQSDGTEAGTLPVLGPDGTPVHGFDELTAFAGRLVFTWRGRLWQTDGTAGGTLLVSDSLWDPAELTVAGSRLFFRATDRAHGSELWALEE